MFDTYKTQKELASIFAPSGRETELKSKLAELAGPYADECRTDALGNLMVRKKGQGKRVLLSAHMDSIGLVVTHIDDNGFIRFCPVGGVPVKDILHSAVTFGRGITGVVGVEEKTEIKDIKAHNAYIDIGAKDEEEAAKLVSVGDMAVYKGETCLAGNRIISPYLDDRIGCVVLLQVLSMIKEPVNDLYFVFSSQEEVGARGAKTAAFGIEPDIAFAVDVTGAGDTPEQKEFIPQKLGGGAAIKIRDNSLITHPTVLKLLESAAKAAKIPVQREVLPYGGTDAGVIHVSRGGVPSGGVSIPTRYIHTPNEMADLSDIESCTRLLTAVCNSKLEL